MITSSNLEREFELDFTGEYVERAAQTVATWLREEPAASREQVIGRFQVENDVIWSPEIYHRVQAILDKIASGAEKRI